jgi:small subunit ribosomal protein S6
MKTYELTYIISSALGSTESDNLRKDLEDFITGQGGTVVKSEKTLAQPLSYPIKKQSSGSFAMVIFQVAEDKIKVIKEKLEKDTNVLRHLFLVKKPAKEMKERRTRKPLTPKATSPETPEKPKKDEGKVEIEEINKKLDEILSE